ncbi:MAG: hypothetical protein A2284_03000 [Deltaproteobacteria bacterium RIFOXYA12_FULL_61_11]|nr:MAG: hypothetical protein A2284_03000 [Deltaproteobacteria bacterium RIFOXYA12_FULL_61_11]
MNWEWIGATTPTVMVSDQSKKVQTKDILEAGKYPVIDQGKMFIRGYCDDSDRVISVAEPIVLFGDHTRETKFIDFDFVVGADGVKLLQPICIDPRFYYLVLRWLPLESRGYARHFKLLRAARIPLPPLAEQKRIVAKVDELMALCDRLEAQQQERETRHAALARASLARFADAPTPANLPFLFHPSYAIPPADLRKSILTLAVQGKLVPQDPNDEPAEDSNDSEDPFDLPQNWSWKSLSEVGICRTGKTPPTSESANYGAGFPFIGPGQITFSGVILPADKEITALGLSNSTEAIADDILMVCIGGSIGKAAICRYTLGFNQQINSIRSQRDCPAFLCLALISGYFQDQVFARASGSATPIINKGKWEQIRIPLPPLAEQRRIVAKVDELMALVDELETQLAASRATGEKLLVALVAELTAGKEPHAAA